MAVLRFQFILECWARVNNRHFVCNFLDTHTTVGIKKPFDLVFCEDDVTHRYLKRFFSSLDLGLLSPSLDGHSRSMFGKGRPICV